MLNQKRIVIDYVSPQVNGGDVFIKRILNEVVNVGAHVLVDGHDVIAASVLFKHEREKSWSEVRMQLIENDEWQASFFVEKQGFYSYKVQGWVDHGLNWQHGIERKIQDNQHVKSELLEGAELLKPILGRANGAEQKYLEHCLNVFVDDNRYEEAITEAQSAQLTFIRSTNTINHDGRRCRCHLYVRVERRLFRHAPKQQC